MKHLLFWVRATALAGVAAMALAALPTQAAPFDGRRAHFADPAFSTVWERTDAERVRTGRTWYWGPQPWFDYAEFFREGINGLRTVQYFDKARMEINNSNDRSFQGGVTNGLLVVELVSGHMKKGNDPADFEARQPANVPVAGNPLAANPNGPTYATFAHLATFDNNGYRDASRLGQRIGTTIDKYGNVSVRQDLADAHAETTIAQFNSMTGHNIPQVFWDFMNRQGPVSEQGTVRNQPVVDWLFAMGLPITDPYWVRARIGDAEKDVFVQLFERRVLTYVPDNPAGFQVEMGNVGQHYFQWRYPNLGQPWAATEPQPPLLFSANISNRDYFEMFAFNINGSVQLTGDLMHPVSSPGTNSVPFSFRRSFDPLAECVFYDSTQGDGRHRGIYQRLLLPFVAESNVVDTCLPQALTFNAPITNPPQGAALQAADDYQPSISPDASKLAFISTRYGVPEIYLAPVGGNTATRLTLDRCTSQHPSWNPDGRTLFWERQCNGSDFTIMRGDLRYQDDGSGATYAELINVRELTDPSQSNRYPRVSPGGQIIAFTSYRDGNGEIYLMDINGGAVRRLTNNASEDEVPAWNATGTQIAFASNRDGNDNIYVMNSDGSGQAALTSSPATEHWPSWAQ